MNMKSVVIKQYRENVNRAKAQVDGLFVPSEGWVRTVRTALGMSGAQLGRRMGITRGAISNNEKAELSGGITIKTMQQMAEAMGCRFVYAIVPEKDIEDIEDIVNKRALEKARAEVKEASIHMALEDQALSKDKQWDDIERLASDMVKNPTFDLWNDE
ncbi:MAG: transcriptional regulator [Methylophaga sp.]|nr:MAG: transcriptional regulator [Methylophaga sp.]